MIPVTAAVIVGENGRVLVCRRRKGDRYGGLWEFPGGKTEADETPEAGLRREIREEMGLDIEIGERFGAFPFHDRESDFAIELSVFRASLKSGTLVLREHDEARWSDLSDLSGEDFSPADRPVVAMLKGSSGR